MYARYNYCHVVSLWYEYAIPSTAVEYISYYMSIYLFR